MLGSLLRRSGAGRPQARVPHVVFRLAHLSDPHLPPPRGSALRSGLAPKRTLSRLAWRRKRREHDPAILAAITADIAAFGRDHVAVTGDLTNFSTDAEFAAARIWLATLGDTADVTVSPGNHDALVAQDEAQRFAGLAPWLGDDGGPAFPHVRRRGEVALVNLCSAVPTPPLFASGRLGAEQVAQLSDLLDDLGREKLLRVVLLHHPPVDGVVSRRKALIDGAELRGVLARCGAELVLHGHGHEAAFGKTAGPGGPIPRPGCPLRLSDARPPTSRRALARHRDLFSRNPGDRPRPRRGHGCDRRDRPLQPALVQDRYRSVIRTVVCAPTALNRTADNGGSPVGVRGLLVKPNPSAGRPSAERSKALLPFSS